MNHEILLALCGHTGDVIVEDSNSFKVRESLSHTFISDADRQVRTFFDSFFFFCERNAKRYQRPARERNRKSWSSFSMFGRICARCNEIRPWSLQASIGGWID